MSQRNARILEEQVEGMTPERAIPHLLKSLHHLLRGALEERLREERIEMSLAHFVTLYMLDSESGLAGAEIARRCLVTAQTMNTILRRLEAEGAVIRRPKPGNSRADSWSLSDAGRKHLNRATIVSEKVWGQLLSALRANEVTQLQLLLRKCVLGFAGAAVPAVTPKRLRSKSAARPRVATAARGRA